MDALIKTLSPADVLEHAHATLCAHLEAGRNIVALFKRGKVHVSSDLVLELLTLERVKCGAVAESLEALCPEVADELQTLRTSVANALRAVHEDFVNFVRLPQAA